MYHRGMAEASFIETLKAVDAPAVALVLGYVLRWALKRIEEKDRHIEDKDKQIADLANRSAAALERALERLLSEGGKGDA